MNGNVLIIEDDVDIREIVRMLLVSEGYGVEEASSGLEGLKLVREDLDLVILDIMMPGISGLKTCEKIRETSNVPILFLTAKIQESDKLLGLMVGGDDYLTKPFSYAELLGRVRALIRRYQVYCGKRVNENKPADDRIELAEISVNKDRNEVMVEGMEVDLTEIEYRILLLMMSYPDQIFSAKKLYESVWKEPYFYSCNGTVMVHIRKLRVKIERDSGNPIHIQTVWGKGYRFRIYEE